MYNTTKVSAQHVANKHTNLLNFMNFNLKMRITLNSKCEANFGQISFVTTVTQFEQAACLVVSFDAYASMHAFFRVFNNAAEMIFFLLES